MLSKYTNTPLPDGNSADDVPAALSAIFDNIDPKLVLYATDKAQRDAEFGDTPVGSLVVIGNSAATLEVYIKVATTNTWQAIWSDTGWVTSGFDVSAGFSLSAARARKLNKMITIQAFVTRTGADIVPTGGTTNAGNVGDAPILDAVPVGFRPTPEYYIPGWFNTSFGGGGYRLNSAGVLYITTLLPGNIWSTDDGAVFIMQFPEG